MKTIKAILPVIVILLSGLLSSCGEDNPNISIKAIEHSLFLEIKAYRLAEGLEGDFSHAFFMVGEAQEYSFKMSRDLVPVSTENLDSHWAELDELYTLYNRDAVVLKSSMTSVSGIFADLLETKGAPESILADITQCGVGIEEDPEGSSYITLLLAKADS